MFRSKETEFDDFMTPVASRGVISKKFLIPKSEVINIPGTSVDPITGRIDDRSDELASWRTVNAAHRTFNPFTQMYRDPVPSNLKVEVTSSCCYAYDYDYEGDRNRNKNKNKRKRSQFKKVFIYNDKQIPVPEIFTDFPVKTPHG